MIDVYVLYLILYVCRLPTTLNHMCDVPILCNVLDMGRIFVFWNLGQIYLSKEYRNIRSCRLAILMCDLKMYFVIPLKKGHSYTPVYVFPMARAGQ